MVISFTESAKIAATFAVSAFICFHAISHAQAATPVLTTINSFTGSNGSHSVSALTLGKGGVLFGTTYDGGVYGYGTVFELTPGTGGVFTQTMLYSFTGFADGGNPQAGLIISPNGVLYGTTEFGGALGVGTVFELTPPAVAGGAYTESVVYSFQAGTDGQFPYSGLTRGASGVLYGCTFNGGTSGDGTVFQVVPGTGGAPATETVLYSFGGNTDGGNPEGTLLMGSGGVLIGTAYSGGYGQVFELTPPVVSGGAWTKTNIHRFRGGNDGANPQAGLISDANGILYGTTYLGGTAGTTGHGTVYQLTPPAVAGGTWTEKVLHSFDLGDGLYVQSPVTLGANGVLYGTTNGGGTDGEQSQGTVFQLTPPVVAGNPWIETILVTFTGTNGQAPDAALVAYQGTLYSTTRYGGATGNDGIVFAVTP